nr:hypothetical protein B0A51_01451 [Rachicladosporium sp. CCFEE 5018]
MVSQVHLDLTSVGDRIAAEIKDALKDLKIHNDKSLTELADRLAAEFAAALSGFKAEQDSILTAEDIGKSVGTAIGKHLMELDAKITKTGSVIEHLDKDLRNEDASTVVKSPRELEDVRDMGITPVETFRNAVGFEYGPDASSLREGILKYATCLWKLKHKGDVPELRIVMHNSGDPSEDLSEAHVVYMEHKNVLRPCAINRIRMLSSDTQRFEGLALEDLFKKARSAFAEQEKQSAELDGILGRY